MRRLDAFQSHSDTFLYVGPSQSVSQSFKPLYDNLAGIRFFVFNPKLGGTKQYQIRILDENNYVLREQTVSESNLGWAYGFRYDFASISGSKGKKHILEISYPEEDIQAGTYLEEINKDQLGQKYQIKDSKLAENYKNSYIKIPYSKNDLYSDGTAVVNGLPLGGDLQFQVYYQTSLKGFLKDSITSASYQFTKDVPFTLIYMSLLVGLFTLLIINLRKHK